MRSNTCVMKIMRYCTGVCVLGPVHEEHEVEGERKKKEEKNSFTVSYSYYESYY